MCLFKFRLMYLILKTNCFEFIFKNVGPPPSLEDPINNNRRSLIKIEDPTNNNRRSYY